MLSITDSRFQDELLRQAKDAGKIERTFEIAKADRENAPDALSQALKPAYEAGLLPPSPFGTDFTDVEQRLLQALQSLKSASSMELSTFVVLGFSSGRTTPALLERLGLA